MKGRLRGLTVAGVTGIVGALAIGAMVTAGGASGEGGGWGGSVAKQDVGNIVKVEEPAAVAGGDVVGGNNATKIIHPDGDPVWDGGGGGGGGGGSVAEAAVNSSGNSANTNTNVAANNTQVGVEQKSTQIAVAVQEQEQTSQLANQGGTNCTDEEENLQLCGSDVGGG